MAINDNGNGKNKFDPSKKVREVLGNDFVDSTENEALERLSQASKTAVRNNTVYNEDMGMSPKDILGKIQHSTVAGQQQHQKFVDQQGLNNQDMSNAHAIGFETAKNEWIKMTSKKSVGMKLVSGAFGMNKTYTKSENVQALVNGTVRAAEGFLVNDFVELSSRVGDTKKTAMVAGVASVFDCVTSMSFGANSKTINKFFDENNITKAESDVIRSAIGKEKFKYGIEHAVAGVVLPTLATFGVNKVVKDKNNIANAVLSFGTFSTIGKSVLQAVRVINDKKNETKINMLPTTIDSKDYYENLAKAVAHKAFDIQLDTTLVGSAVGSFVGYRSVKFETPVFGKFITELKVDDKSTKSDTVIVKPVVHADVVTSATLKTPSTKTTKSSKKSA